MGTLHAQFAGALGGRVTCALPFPSSVVIQNLEGSLITPFVHGDQFDMHPLLVFIAVLAGAVLLGPHDSHPCAGYSPSTVIRLRAR